ncbi:O-antigen ligase family protein [Lysinimonas soli]|uniref:O-antigen ligase family protein n=1 Tax=Lysinimonas soli TaxID=1074233 RepID=A0ABW0NK75_9MICO
MTAEASVSAPRPLPLRTTHRLDAAGRSNAPLLLRFTAFAIFFFPSSMIIAPLGAVGTVSMILSCLLFLFWLASWLWGLHDPIPLRHPGRLAGAVFALGIMASYISLYGGWVGEATVTGLAAADRWVVLVIASLGLILCVGDALNTRDEVLSVARWLIAGGFFSSLVGVVQFTFHVDPMAWIQSAMPGFTYNGGVDSYQARGNLIRVAGSTFHSIEFAVTSSMLLPLSIWRSMFDPRGARWFHWAQTLFLGSAVILTVSRSGALGVATALIISLPFMPRLVRRWTLVIVPILIVIAFALVPGFVGTLTSALTANASDPSIANRLNNYPRVELMIDQRPLLGTGPGTYDTSNLVYVLDNQYLTSAVTTGIIGLICVAFYLLAPAVMTVVAARHTSDPNTKALAGALAGGLAAAGICSVGFDSLSFPVFALTYPLMVALAGAVWKICKAESGIPGSSPIPFERGA